MEWLAATIGVGGDGASALARPTGRDLSGQPVHIALRGRAEQPFVLAVEMRGVAISHAVAGAGGVDVVAEHEPAGLLESAFFPWHRMYLHLFEQQLQLVDPTVSLPYWDWTVDNATDSWIWQDDFMGGDGSDDDDEAVISGPFR